MRFQPIASKLAAAVMVVVIKRFGNAISMRSRGRHNQKVEHLMGAAPNVEFARHDGLGNAGSVEEGSDDEEEAFEKIVWHPALPIHLVNAEKLNAVDERCEAR